jgi:hypothetical protein
MGLKIQPRSVMNTQKATEWVGLNMPYRPRSRDMGNMYCTWPFTQLPPAPVLPMFEGVQRISKAHKKVLEATSPSACYFTRGTYRDQQGCEVWRLIEGRVFTRDLTCVADSLPEFLSRMLIENLAWHKMNDDAIPEPEEADAPGATTLLLRANWPAVLLAVDAYVAHMKAHNRKKDNPDMLDLIFARHRPNYLTRDE